VARLSALVEELAAQRAEERVGSTVDVLVESLDGDVAEGRGEHQAPEVDGTVTVTGVTAAEVGDFVRGVVVSSSGVDLVARA
jgi:tRNA A37 methylthiotransferase MiaB